MRCRPIKPHTLRKHQRTASGSIMPLLAFSMIFIFAFAAFVMDVMREILEIQQLKFAAKAAALDAFSCAALDANGQAQNTAICNTDGSFIAQALTQMQTELTRANGGDAGAAWNQAISNPTGIAGQSWLKDVTVQNVDLHGSQSTGNDKNDPLLQLTVRRSDNDAMNVFFLPVQYASNLMTGGANKPSSKHSIVQTIEIVGQPATRIGPGADSSSTAGKSQLLANGRFAAFPVSINYDDFKRVLSSANATSISTQVHVCDPSSAQLGSASDLRGYFVNLKDGGSVSDYYWDAQNPSRVSDLIGLLQYFNVASSVPEAVQAPAAVEQSVHLDRFNFTSYGGNQDLATVIAQLPLNRCYIVPVVSEGVSPSTECKVIGFALLNLVGVTKNSGNWVFQFNIGESLPVPNASCSPGMATIPKFDGSALPAPTDPQGPFAPRSFDMQNNVLSARPMGVVLAPSVSPRKIVTQ